MDLLKLIRSEVAKATARAHAMVRRGVLGAGLSSDSEAKVGGPGGDDHEGIESWQHYGFRSRPPVGSEVLMVCPYGRGEGAIVCAEHDRDHVPSCAAGEVVLYGSANGTPQAEVRLGPGGDVEVNGADVDVGATGGINLTPTTVVDIGGAGLSVDFMIKGTTFILASTTLTAAIAAATTTWQSGSKQLADVDVWVMAVAAAFAAYNGALAGTLATKGMVT